MRAEFNDLTLPRHPERDAKALRILGRRLCSFPFSSTFQPRSCFAQTWRSGLHCVNCSGDCGSEPAVQGEIGKRWSRRSAPHSAPKSTPTSSNPKPLLQHLSKIPEPPRHVCCTPNSGQKIAYQYGDCGPMDEIATAIARCAGVPRLGRASIAGRAEPSITVAAARSSSAV